VIADSFSLAVWPAPVCRLDRPDLLEKAERLSNQLSVPLLACETDIPDRERFAFLLCLDEDGVALQQGKSRIAVNFSAGANHHRRLHGGGRGQPIAKAIGIKAGNILPTVLDCTAGLARDAFVLASLGCRLQMCERSPLVRALLEDGLARGHLADDVVLREIMARMQLMPLHAAEYMCGLEDAEKPDVVYLDPMFPERRKRAAVKKDMAAFHTLVGADDDADALLAPALQVARYRVVVKRPRHAPYLGNCKPGLVLEGESTRFDIYPLRTMAMASN
jgi:16S rRNA (guanine1516-N2)-methyltransferase